MKKCTCCGKKSSDKLLVCPHDGGSLVLVSPIPPVIEEFQKKLRTGEKRLLGFRLVPLLCTVWCGLLLGGALLPAIAKARFASGRIGCCQNIREINSAMNLWTSEHHGVLPANLFELANYGITPEMLVCPADPKRSRKQGSNYITYQWILPVRSQEDVSTNIVLICPIHGAELLGDGFIQFSRNAPRLD